MSSTWYGMSQDCDFRFTSCHLTVDHKNTHCKIQPTHHSSVSFNPRKNKKRFIPSNNTAFVLNKRQAYTVTNKQHCHLIDSFHWKKKINYSVFSLVNIRFSKCVNSVMNWITNVSEILVSFYTKELTQL